MPRLFLSLAGLPLFLVLSCLCLYRIEGAEPESGEAVVHALIAQLGHEDQAVRDRATQRLSRRDDAEQAVRLALRSGDAEVVRRARRILDALRGRKQARFFDALHADARAGRADLMAERMVAWQGKHDEPDLWQPLFELCQRSLALAEGRKIKIRGDESTPASFRSFRQFAAKLSPKHVVGDPDVIVPALLDAPHESQTVRGRKIGSRQSSGGIGLFVANERVSAPPGFGVFLLCAGDVETSFIGGGAVAVCGGDFVCTRNPLSDCVIIARGSVRCRSVVMNSVILAGGDVTFHDAGPETLTNCVIRAGGRVPFDKRRVTTFTNVEINEDDKTALDCARFFETKDVGLEMTKDKEGVRVASAAAGQPFALAGVRKGDLIASCDGTPIKSPEDLRRHLRRRVAVEKSALLDVRREGRPLAVRVRFD